MRQGALGQLDPEFIGQSAAILVQCAALQPFGNLRAGNRIQVETTLGHCLAVANLARVDGNQAITIGRTPSGAKSLANILGHAGEPLLPAH